MNNITDLKDYYIQLSKNPEQTPANKRHINLVIDLLKKEIANRQQMEAIYSTQVEALEFTLYNTERNRKAAVKQAQDYYQKLRQEGYFS